MAASVLTTLERRTQSYVNLVVGGDVLLDGRTGWSSKPSSCNWRRCTSWWQGGMILKAFSWCHGLGCDLCLLLLLWPLQWLLPPFAVVALAVTFASFCCRGLSSDFCRLFPCCRLVWQMITGQEEMEAACQLMVAPQRLSYKKKCKQKKMAKWFFSYWSQLFLENEMKKKRWNLGCFSREVK